MKKKLMLMMMVLSVMMLTACGGTKEVTPKEEVSEEVSVETTDEIDTTAGVADVLEGDVSSDTESDTTDEMVTEPVVEEETVEEESTVEPAYAVSDEIAFEAYVTSEAISNKVAVKKIDGFEIVDGTNMGNYVLKDYVYNNAKIQYALYSAEGNPYYWLPTYEETETPMTNADGEEIVFKYVTSDAFDTNSVFQDFTKYFEVDGTKLMLVISVVPNNGSDINPEDWVELTRDCYFVFE